jgi:GT2 family glycosyltransferase
MLEFVPVVIPYFRAPDALAKCLEAISAQEEVTTEIFVRDNSEDNILFTKAINEGLRRFLTQGNAQFILVLNQDAYLRSQCLIHLLQTMQSFPKAGIVIPVSVNAENNHAAFAALQAYPWGVTRLGNLHEIPKEPYATYWANGACMLLRVKMIQEIGLLDENMRFICSDSDYSFTARSRGWDVMVSPNAVVEHSLNGSGRGVDAVLEEIKLSDQLYFGQKWLSADLYRRLSYEGPHLTTEMIDKEIRTSQSNLMQMRQYLNNLQTK